MTHKLFAVGLSGMSLLAVSAIAVPVNAAQQFSCTGKMTNGWSYNAQFVDGRFTQITWNRSGQPPQVSTLTFNTTNSQGQPVYRGSFQGATAVTLVDLGQGNVRPGSQISVGVEEWGWSRGTCGVGSAGGGAADGLDELRQTTIGNEQWRNSMRAQGFIFDRTIEQTSTRAIERWVRTWDRSAVDVVIVNNRAVEVRKVP